MSGHWLKAARHLRFQSTISRFESSRPSQPVLRSEKISLILAERPANGGLLRISHEFLGSDIGHSRSEIADSLRQIFEKLPFLGDCGQRPGSICTAWPKWSRYLPRSPTTGCRNREFPIMQCVTGFAPTVGNQMGGGYVRQADYLRSMLQILRRKVDRKEIDLR